MLKAVTVVELAGDIDANTAPLVREKVLPIVVPGNKIILNMTDVPYMSSAGLRMLLTLYRQASSQDIKLLLVGLSEEIQDTMSVTGFLDFFQASETLESGLEVLK